jgi:hypothetical protein
MLLLPLIASGQDYAVTEAIHTPNARDVITASFPPLPQVPTNFVTHIIPQQPAPTLAISMTTPAQLLESTDFQHWTIADQDTTNLVYMQATNAVEFFAPQELVTLAWMPSPSPCVTGYYIYCYWKTNTNSMQWRKTDVGLVTNATLPGFSAYQDGWRASCYDANGDESAMSAAVFTPADRTTISWVPRTATDLMRGATNVEPAVYRADTTNK